MLHHEIIHDPVPFSVDIPILIGFRQLHFRPTGSVAESLHLLFDDYRELQGGRLPHRMEVRFGDNVFGTLQIDAYEFTEPK